MIQNAVDRNVYKQLVISENGCSIGISHIQYADDTVQVGEMTIQNVRAVKCILRNF